MGKNRNYKVRFNEKGDMEILNLEDIMLITVGQLLVIHGMEHCSGEELYELVEENYADVLSVIESNLD